MTTDLSQSTPDRLAEPVRRQFDRRPSAAAYMLRALRPSPGIEAGVPEFDFRWKGIELTRTHLDQFAGLVGLSRGAQAASIIWPQVAGMPLVMAILTEPRFPFPIWNALQVRNRLTLLAPMPVGGRFEFAARTDAARVIEKGVEIDVQVEVQADGTRVWQGLTTFYYRGRFGSAKGPAPEAPPAVTAPATREFRMPVDGRLAYSALSGDYNGVHLLRAWARMFGFGNAFLHPHRAVGFALSAGLRDLLQQPGELSLWFRGPVPYGAKVRYTETIEHAGRRFALHLEEDPRPCIVADWVGR